MNKIALDVLLTLFSNEFKNQRSLTEKCGYSLGSVNSALSSLKESGLINEDCSLTKKGISLINDNSPESAVILAAGQGLRLVPINGELPKALIYVNNKPLIEYHIENLKKAGIEKIYIVVGYLKEQFEYLIDKYDIELVVNMEYKDKNNLTSLYKVKDKISNTYIVPCDIWCNFNPFSKNEVYSWYMMSEGSNSQYAYAVNKKMQILKTNKSGNTPVGISYISKSDSKEFVKRLESMAENSKYDNSFWEEACFTDGKMFQYAKSVNEKNYIEINTYEDLRNADNESINLRSKEIDIIKNTFDCSYSDIVILESLDKGMTNRSFLFSCKKKKYIMRVPGEGTEMLINRKKEANNYSVIKDYDICDNVIYFNAENGYKITEFIENARVCDAYSKDDLVLSMKLLKKVHNLKLKVDYEFDLFQQIDYYEKLRGTNKSVFKDYNQTKENVLLLKDFIDENKPEYCLTHIDAVPDNFLFFKGSSVKTGVKLIDWEYAAMQDPHVDLAMFSVYAFYNKEDIDNLIDIYFENKCTKKDRIKIYCYVAVCGLLWSNWCEYKQLLGIEFGEYFIKQYRYAKEFFKIAQSEISSLKGIDNGKEN